VAGSINVETARSVDRQTVLELLEERGLDAKAGDSDLTVEVRCDDCGELLVELETLVRDAELPLVPVEADGRIFLRPPGD
jgi:hypothetical protein